MAESKIVPAMQGLRVPIDSVSLDPNNVRKHDEAQLSKLKGALSIYGQVSPIVAQKSTNVIRKGNATWIAAKALGWTEIAVVYVEMDDTTARAYAIADNRLSELPEWDMEGLSDSLKLLEEVDYDLPSLGWDSDELLLLKDWKPEVLAADVVEDEAPALLEKAVSQTGDLWLLGEHRVLCGDSTKAEDVGRAMRGNKAQMVFTDPPYGVDLQECDMAQAEVRGRRKDGKGIVNDNLTGESLCEFLFSAFGNAIAHTIPGACWYVCAPASVDYRHSLNTLADLAVARHGIAWVKDRFAMGRADYHYRHENIIYGWTPGGAHKPVPTRDQDTVWEFARPGRSPEHPTMKPVGLVSKAISNSSDSGRIILDPFLGSGSTLIAAEQLSRKCYGLEIEPRYVDVIVKRWQEFTKRDATLEGADKTFAAIAAEKGKPCESS